MKTHDEVQQFLVRFKKEIRKPFPVKLLEPYKNLQAFGEPRSLECDMIGTPWPGDANPTWWMGMTVSELRHLADDTFLTGFGGYGFASYGYYLIEVRGPRRVYFRIGYYDYNHVRNPDAVAKLLTNYEAFWRGDRAKTIRQLRLLDNMGRLEFKITLNDGTILREQEDEDEVSDDLELAYQGYNLDCLFQSEEPETSE